MHNSVHSSACFWVIYWTLNYAFKTGGTWSAKYKNIFQNIRKKEIYTYWENARIRSVSPWENVRIRSVSLRENAWIRCVSLWENARIRSVSLWENARMRSVSLWGNARMRSVSLWENARMRSVSLWEPIVALNQISHHHHREVWDQSASPQTNLSFVRIKVPKWRKSYLVC